MNDYNNAELDSELRATLDRLDDALEENARQLRELPRDYDEFGEEIIAPRARRRLRELLAEREELRESADAAMRL